MRIHDLVFFLSGAASLIYQVVWLRLAGRAIGSDALGAALVLAGFMGGMALGARLPGFDGIGRRLRAHPSPQGLYAALLFATAVWAGLSPLGFEAIEGLTSFGARSVATLLLLLPPTLAMGASFPLMGRLTIAGPESAGAATGGFYGANTAGAAAGALAAPFVILPALGFSASLWAGAGCDTAAGLLALLLLGGSKAVPDPPGTPAVESPAAISLVRRLLLGTALMGASALAFEVLLTRILSGLTGSSIHAYGILLFVFLAGLALGARQAGAWLAAGRSALDLFTLCACAAAPLAFAGLLLLDLRIGDASAVGSLRNLSTAGGGTAKLWFAQALLAGLALLPPTLAFGAALPAAIGAAARARGGDSTSVLARLYAANTLGAALGALAGGLLLSVVGLPAALALSLFASTVAGLLHRQLSTRRVELARVSLVAAGLLLGAFALRSRPGAPELLAEYHSMVSTASVEERPSADPDAPALRVLRVNGKVVAGTAPIDLRLQRLLGAIPLVLHGDVERALVVGLGTGMTAASLLPGPALEVLDVVELSPALLKAARWFEPWLDGLFESSALRLTLSDGRPFLARATDRWDLITSDPIHPWTRGSSDLYALEHFQRIAAALEPGGIASQWLPLYQLSSADVDTVLATWVAAFPRTSAYLTGYDLVLVGRIEGPVDLHRVSAERSLLPRLELALGQVGIANLAELAALEVADDAALRARCAGIEPMLLDAPRLEFSAPASFLGGVSDEFLRWCVRPEQAEALPAPLRPAALRNAQALLEFLDPETTSDWKLRASRYGRRLLAPDRPSAPAEGTTLEQKGL